MTAMESPAEKRNGIGPPKSFEDLLEDWDGLRDDCPRARWGKQFVMNKWITGEWVVDRTNAKQRRVLHYWFTILWFTVGLALWVVLRNELWFVGFMSLYAIWITHLAGWAAETPVETEDVPEDAVGRSVAPDAPVAAPSEAT